MYWNSITQELISRPKSKVTSNLWLNPEKLLEEGWLLVVDSPAPVLSFGEYVSSHQIVDNGDGTASRSAVVVVRSLAEQKAWVKTHAKAMGESKLGAKYGVHEVHARLEGLLGAAARTAYLTDLDTYVTKYQQFAGEVNTATTMAELETVWNNYPQLH